MHKFLSLFLFLFFASSSALMAQNTVSATVTGFKNEKGVCRACIFNNAEAFKGKGKPVQCIQVAISGKKAMVSFSGLPSGTYAISLFHDANNNNKFDTNFLGIPKEGYGASGNSLPFAAAPGFDANKFDLKGNKVLSPIKLRYL